MNFDEWANSRIKNLSWCDIQLIKFSVMGFTLMAAKQWKKLLSLNWYWYAFIMIIAAIKPFYKTMVKD